jgi:DNA polymerase (family 10)
MDSRTAALALTQIADLLELRGENPFKSRAYRGAARAVLDLGADDLLPLLRSGELEASRGIGPASLGVLRDLAERGESEYLERLREGVPEGLFEMLRVPGLSTEKIHLIHQELGVQTVDDLAQAAEDGRLAGLKGFGPKTVEKLVKGIVRMREASAYRLIHRAMEEARRLREAVAEHPGVGRAIIAGSIRRRRELVRDIDIVAACTSQPSEVGASFARIPGVSDALGVGGRSVSIRFVDGTILHLHCTEPARLGLALWFATGSEEHVREMTARAAARGLELHEDSLRDSAGREIPVADEVAVFDALGLAYIEPELREGLGEIAAAESNGLPTLVARGDLRGVLHAHSTYSDGKASIAEMSAGARARGYSYLGISDHSQSAFYAGGMSRDTVLAQHEEIDRYNESNPGVRVLKGIEADILVDGRIDYDEQLLDRFDYVIGSVHSRFGLDERTMTDRVLRALDDPHLTILGHPTGRLLLTREPYAIDMQAVLEKAAETGVAVELNADPHRLDLDWRLCREARRLGVSIEIGPDAHSVAGLDNMEIGVGIARKGWLAPRDILNTFSADEIVARATRRKQPAP